MSPVYLFIYKVKALFLENQNWHDCALPPTFSQILFMCVFLRQEAKEEVVFLVIFFFYKTVSAATLECCKKMLLIPETVVYPWRERLGCGEIIFFPRCTALQTRVKQCCLLFIIIFLDLFDLPSFCLSLHPPPVSPIFPGWGAGNKPELCFLTSKEL